MEQFVPQVMSKTVSLNFTAGKLETHKKYVRGLRKLKV